ncbi:hypothetical protein [Pseudomonas japonica]|uniref:Uncharacterized protein n=1 Tax=Pseudomonas japonica TaxID=256466 RepID=A0A239HK92_9PSED|nr:hypothetical protein [Pseudomonas japonica]SNS81819.1 hypothetical protein SAMN05444352_115160 [Pseudomonas japonica]
MLPRIDLQAVERAERDRANQELSRYLCSTLADMLPRIPTTAQRVPLLIEDAGKLAYAAGHYQGRAYSIYVIICFLLGPGWEYEPGNRQIVQILSDSGMGIDDRLDMALNRTLDLRQQFESILPQMLDLIGAVLTQRDGLSIESLWETFQRLAHLRGVVYEDRILDWLEVYEADAFNILPHAPFGRKRLTKEDICRYRDIGWSLPQPADPYRSLEPGIARKVGFHALIAMAYGRRFFLNPLLRSLPPLLSEALSPSPRTTALQAFLQQHRHALMEHTHVK